MTAAPPAADAQPTAEPAHRRAARCAWAMLLARIYVVFLPGCPPCGTEMRVVALPTKPVAVRAILARIGEPAAPLRTARACGPLLWEAADPEHDRCADPLLQSVPAFEFDQRLTR